MNNKQIKNARRETVVPVELQADLLSSMHVPFWPRMLHLIGIRKPYQTYVARWGAMYKEIMKRSSKRIAHDKAKAK